MKYHIEFSERGSGKTKKLVQAIQEHLDSGENVVVVTNNFAQVAIIKRNFDCYGNQLRFAIDPNDDNLRGVRGRRFFDEFVANSSIMKPEFRPQEGDYFCSSLPKNENEIDVMVKVVSLYA